MIIHVHLATTRIRQVSFSPKPSFAAAPKALQSLLQFLLVTFLLVTSPLMSWASG